MTYPEYILPTWRPEDAIDLPHIRESLLFPDIVAHAELFGISIKAAILMAVAAYIRTNLHGS